MTEGIGITLIIMGGFVWIVAMICGYARWYYTREDKRYESHR